jgi:hypothetical protein
MASATSTTKAPSAVAVAGAVLLVITGLIDLLVYFGVGLSFDYPGFLFLLNALFAIVFAAGVLARITAAWHLGAALSVVTALLFVLARTTGLPGIHFSDWVVMLGFLPLGPLSLIAELAFLPFYAIALRPKGR